MGCWGWGGGGMPFLPIIIRLLTLTCRCLHGLSIQSIWLCNQSFGTEQPAQIHTLYMTPSETRSMRMSHDLT